MWSLVTPRLKQLYPELGDLVVYLSWDEIKNSTIPTINELKLRKNNGVWLFNDEIIDYKKLKIFEQQFDFILDDEVKLAEKEFSGEIACKGMVRGLVRKILKEEELKTFKDGEVLISYMTMPAFMPAMRKAIAFVTDEGGITCHAAIMARELHKPCIIGTKIATKVLNNGDEVEVDANNGVVRILSKK